MTYALTLASTLSLQTQVTVCLLLSSLSHHPASFRAYSTDVLATFLFAGVKYLTEQLKNSRFIFTHNLGVQSVLAGGKAVVGHLMIRTYSADVSLVQMTVNETLKMTIPQWFYVSKKITDT